jgi:hypothetical protein
MVWLAAAYSRRRTGRLGGGEEERQFSYLCLLLELLKGYDRRSSVSLSQDESNPEIEA